jgi:SAM-dependent methyltransferase
MAWGEQGYLRYFPSLTWQCTPQLPRVLARVSSSARIVDLGAGGRLIDPRHIRVDLRPCAHTTVCGDGENLPLLSGSVDLVLATGLLEHVVDASRVLEEMTRVLKPGGFVHIEAPFLQQEHDDPIDCRRFTVQGLERELRGRGLNVIASGAHIGPTVTMITLGAYYIQLLFEGPSSISRALATLMFFAWSVCTYPLKFIDRWLVTRPTAHRLAFGIYCTAQVPRTLNA